MRHSITRTLALPLAAICMPAVLGGGCARVAVEGGDKPIHIVMDVNLRVERQLDNFFAFEDQVKPAPATKPAPVSGT